MKKHISAILAFVMALCLVPPVSWGEDSVSTVSLIVEVEGDAVLTAKEAVAVGAAAYSETQQADAATDKIIAAQSVVQSSLKKVIDKSLEVEYTYTHLFNGFSIKAKESDIERIKTIPGVKNVYLASRHAIPDPIISVNNAANLTNVPAAKNTGYNGEGTVVAVIDLGLAYNHEFFQESPVNPKLSMSDIAEIINTKNLNVDVAPSQVYHSAKIPFLYDYVKKSSDTYYDKQNHGTHVAGIAVGKNGTLPNGEKFSGIAPEAQLVFMSCGNSGNSLDEDSILAALEDAAKIGVDVINMSYGSDYSNGVSTPEMIAIDNAKSAGIQVMAAAGNADRGNDATLYSENIDYSSLSTPASFSSATAVASVDNSASMDITIKATLGDKTQISLKRIYSNSQFADIFSDGITRNYVYCGLGDTNEFTEDITGKIAVIDRGNLTFAEKTNNAAAAGAEGVIIINNVPGAFTTDPLSLPVALAQLSDKNALLNNSEILVQGEDIVNLPVDSVGTPSDFSSWGVLNLNELKPDISAPGGSIYSSVPGNLGKCYAYFSGTSMATPHMSGIAAIMSQYYKTNPFISEYNGLTGADKTSLIENLLMSSAVIIRDDNDVSYSPRLQGAGLADASAATQAQVTIEGGGGKPSVALGENITDSFSFSVKLKNISPQPVTYDEISLEVTTDDCKPNNGHYVIDGTKSLTVKGTNLPSQITLESGEEYTLNIDVTLDTQELSDNSLKFPNGFYIDGFLSFSNSTGETVTECAPFFGFCGDWDAAPIFDTTIYDENGSSLGEVSFDENGFLSLEGTGLCAYNSTKNYLEQVLGMSADLSLCDKACIAFSNGSSRLFDRLNLFLKNYRHTSDISITIKDALGKSKVSLRARGTSFNSFSTMTMGFETALGSLTDGDYTVNVTGTLAYSDNLSDDSFSIPLVIDSIAPIITDVVYDDESGTAQISATDNHYINNIYLYYTDSNNRVNNTDYIVDKSSDIDENGIVTADFNVPSNARNIRIGCTDYAGNDLDIPLSGALKKISSELMLWGGNNTSTSVTLNIRNNTAETVSGSCIVAFYSKSGSLIGTAAAEKSFAEYEQKLVNFGLLTDTGTAATIKFFMWDSLGNAVPISEYTRLK